MQFPTQCGRKVLGEFGYDQGLVGNQRQEVRPQVGGRRRSASEFVQHPRQSRPGLDRLHAAPLGGRPPQPALALQEQGQGVGHRVSREGVEGRSPGEDDRRSGPGREAQAPKAAAQAVKDGLAARVEVGVGGIRQEHLDHPRPDGGVHVQRLRGEDRRMAGRRRDHFKPASGVVDLGNGPQPAREDNGRPLAVDGKRW